MRPNGVFAMTSSNLNTRNAALAVAQSFGPLREGDPLIAHLASNGRLMKAMDFCTNDARWGEQVDLGRVPYLLFEDPLNAGEVTHVEIEDRLINAVESNTGLCTLVLHVGQALVPPDTVVYWG
jgi:hypothetical protein